VLPYLRIAETNRGWLVETTAHSRRSGGIGNFPLPDPAPGTLLEAIAIACPVKP